MRYASIRKTDISNGKGIRVSIFFQGCNFHCKNCWNETTWDLNKGKEFTQELQNKFIELAKQPYIEGISILGGEPFIQDKNELNDFLKRCKTEVKKNIWLWTGYKFDLIPNKEALNYLDVIIDGQFIEELKDWKLKYRGSSNQNIYRKEKDKWVNVTYVIDKQTT